MATEIVFEIGTLADVISKAASIAPSRAGSAFDKAAGIMLEITPNDEVQCVVKATNLDVFYLEVVDCISVQGDNARWRIPSFFIAEVMKNMKPVPGKNVKLARVEGKNLIAIQSGRLRATVGLIDPEYYPDFDVVDPDDLHKISGLGARIEAVSWAAAKAGTEPLNGVHFDGTHIAATDGYRVARAPLSIPLATPVTVPVVSLAPLLKRAGEIEVGFTDFQMVIRPDEYTQIVCSLFGMSFPDVGKLDKLTYDRELRINKTALVDLINSTGAAAAGDRNPILRLILGKEEVAAMLQGHETMVGNVEPVPGQCDHPRINVYFTPGYLLDAVSKSPTETVTIHYREENETRVATRIDGGPDYRAWIAPRKNLSDE